MRKLFVRKRLHSPDKKAAGFMVIEAKYDHAERFAEGVVAAMINGKYGFIDGKFFPIE